MSSRLSRGRSRSVAPAKPRYLALVRRFPLRPIRSDEENEAALAMLGSLAEHQREDPLAPEEHDYIAVLARLVEDYEGARYPRGPVPGPAMLAHLMEARGLGPARLATETGMAESTVAGLLRGARPIGPRQARILARYFEVDPALFQDG